VQFNGTLQELLLQTCDEVQSNVPVLETEFPQLSATLFDPQNVLSAGV